MIKNIDQIKQLFESFNNKTILVIGDIMIDSYMTGKVDRISPEAPIPIVSVKHKEDRLGGAANVALNIKSLGAKAIICSVIGKDKAGNLLMDIISKRELPQHGIIQNEDCVTTIKTRILSNNQQLIRIDEELTLPIPEIIENDFIDSINKIIKSENIDAIIFQDYDKGNITPVVIDEITEKANELKIPILADPKKRNFNRYKNISFFKPNFKELSEGVNINLEKYDFPGIYSVVKRIQKERFIETVMVTLSEAGVFIADKNGYKTLPAEVRDIADVSGAGDTVISLAGLCLSAGLKTIDIAAISNIAGGLVCEKPGVVPVDKEQLLIECIEAYTE